jgi:hypothetical protein
MEIQTITIKQMPEDIHRTVRRIKLDMEEYGKKMTIEQIYIDLINRGLDHYRKEIKSSEKPSFVDKI